VNSRFESCINSELNYHSELNLYSYDDSSLAWTVRAILEKSNMFIDLEYDKLADEIERSLNDPEILSNLEISKNKHIKPLSETISFSRNYYYQSVFQEVLNDRLDIKEIEILENNGKEKYFDIGSEVRRLYNSSLRSSIDRYHVFDSEAFKSLIKNYCLLSANCVFNPGNVNLNNLLFRQSKTLEALYCVGRIPFQNNEKKRKSGYAYFNVCSPYVAEPFLRTVDKLKDLLDQNFFDCLDYIPVLKELRTEIFVNKIIRSFMRFTSYNKFTNYRVTLNRHNSELMSIPYNELSSIEEVKPLRLFEKIISHLHFRLDELTEKTNDKLTVNVGVIGHAEVSYESINKLSDEPNSYSEDYREIYDLLRVLVDWYNRLEISNAPKLSLIITYFVNENDVLRARSIDSLESIDAKTEKNGHYYEKGGNKGFFYVEKCSYINSFNFSKRKLLNIIDDNDVVFVLDCPWMTMESYELLSDGKLKSYCNSLFRRKNNIGYKSYLSLDSDKNTELQYLDAQYNRITSSDSVYSGFISRVFRDDYLRAIADSLKAKQTDSLRKDVYVFTSEKDGVDYSYLGSYPILRKEMYGDKVFSIAHFSNRRSEMLKLAKDGEELSFYIRLWSVFKYVAVSYVFVYFRKVIDDIFSGYSLSVEDFFELLRAIVVKLTSSYDLKKICISIGYDESVMENIKESLGIRDDALTRLKHKLHEYLKPFVKALYKEVIFSDYEAFGYDTIRTAFEMNMYSSARNVESMLFIHFYSKKREKRQIKDFVVDFDLEKYNSFKMKEEFRHFKDKRLYQMLFKVLEKTNQYYIDTKIDFSKAENLFFGCSHSSVEKTLLKNIVEVCRNTNRTDSDIYRNALYAL